MPNASARFSREFAQLEPVATALERRAHARATTWPRRRRCATTRRCANWPTRKSRPPGRGWSSSTRELLAHLVPKDPRDDGNIYLEVRAGTGGDEAAIFAGDLFRMYSRYAERQGWRVEVESASPGEHGGFKEVIARVEGPRRVLAAQVRIGHASRAARAGTPNRRAASTPRPRRSRSSRSRPTRRRSRSTRPTCASTPSAPRAPAASTSTRPTRRSASRTCPAASWSRARPNAASTPTATRR